jgi:hypothetical protein
MTGVSLALGALLAVTLWNTFGNYIEGWTRTTNVLFSMTNAVCVVGVILAYIAVFMNVAYPKIPEQFGGGEPRSINLLVKKGMSPG